MSKYKCDVIRDLLPLYVDNVCSDETKKIVEEHISECECCKIELNCMETELLKLPETTGNSGEVIKKIKKKLFRQRVMLVVLCSVLVIGLTIGVFTKVMSYEIAIPYEDIKISVEPSKNTNVKKGTLDVTYSGEAFDDIRYMPSETREDGGIVYESYVFCYQTTPWFRCFNKYTIESEVVDSIAPKSVYTEYIQDSKGKIVDQIEKPCKLEAIYYQEKEDGKKHLLWKMEK